MATPGNPTTREAYYHPLTGMVASGLREELDCADIWAHPLLFNSDQPTFFSFQESFDDFTHDHPRHDLAMPGVDDRYNHLSLGTADERYHSRDAPSPCPSFSSLQSSLHTGPRMIQLPELYTTNDNFPELKSFDEATTQSLSRPRNASWPATSLLSTSPSAHLSGPPTPFTDSVSTYYAPSRPQWDTPVSHPDPSQLSFTGYDDYLDWAWTAATLAPEVWQEQHLGGAAGPARSSPFRRRRSGKKQPVACVFCRERKIACGRPAGAADGGTGAGDQSCKYVVLYPVLPSTPE
ncbi:unnamed protein product [Mycena citricolor]|uniref:Uncharacterized protein n=1 Tax=Mycena citricolor TaxID=2018698 RepID=A0AAD2H1U6_9AGAR|nr:unnamed protein product [Mycena citricolor]